ncbi:hypothetical protein SNOG_06979 [Parastagonospora nodorum SN15]|uniref:Uncharacterized protein n=1 Tax=Phaeosphaeria nodorum (strain SN15 / ATCC MYA-4574 / FGSC 10173) TaxID=321614 RepID=Q0UMN5_PHANO|nr:hypothetical protein SNOG_06979 [Parastagonospora nodorum SN15]EAT85630.1 hypothetical protein SNOG_06979 [Parastagonospora nodorum SN15]
MAVGVQALLPLIKSHDHEGYKMSDSVEDSCIGDMYKKAH